MNILFKHILEYNRHENKNIKIFTLKADIQKAFDSLIHSILLNKYLQHDMNSNILNVLIDVKK